MSFIVRGHHDRHIGDVEAMIRRIVGRRMYRSVFDQAVDEYTLSIRAGVIRHVESLLERVE
jgi:hypothetical protein